MGLIAKMSGWLVPSALSETERRAIERAVDCVDPRLRVVSGYQRKLAAAVGRAVDYCDGLVAAIPGPIDIDIHAFGNDPLVHAFFAAPDDINHMLGASRELKTFVADAANLAADDFFGLIGMRRKEKTVFGPGQQGAIIHDDVPQRLLYFADHTLRELSPDIERTRGGLRESAFDSLAGSFAEHLERLRHEKSDLRTSWEQEGALARSLAVQAPSAAEAHAHRKFEIEEGLRAAASSLEPARVLEALAAWLADPEPHLYLVSTSVSVDRLGVLSKPAADDPDIRTLNFPELVGRDRRRWIVLLTRISRAAALRAQEQYRDAHRYMVI